LRNQIDQRALFEWSGQQIARTTQHVHNNLKCQQVRRRPCACGAHEQPATGSPPTSGASAADSNLDQKLKSISLSLDFNNAEIGEATDFLTVESKRLDPEHEGVSFVIQSQASKSAKPVTLK
jgi:hypothetical protein